jgi:hypothetical protein
LHKRALQECEKCFGSHYSPFNPNKLCGADSIVKVLLEKPRSLSTESVLIEQARQALNHSCSPMVRLLYRRHVATPYIQYGCEYAVGSAAMPKLKLALDGIL